MIRFLFAIYLISSFVNSEAQVINPVTITPISIQEVGTAYQQNFNSLVMSDSSNIPPLGWQLRESGSVANNFYMAGNGSSNRGDIYSFGSINSSERALGSLNSTIMLPSFGALFINNTSDTIKSITICYTGEQWRLGTINRTDKYDFYYSLINTNLNTTSGWTDLNELDFISPAKDGSTGLKDGNNPAFQTKLMHTLSNIALAPGKTFMIRFFDIDAAGTDDGLAIDDFVLVGHKNIILPVVATVNVLNPLSNIVQVYSKVFFGGNDLITSRGVVIGTAKNPTIHSNQFITSDGNGLGEFYSEITTLLPNITYYVRSYAITASGVGYGEEIAFTTPASAKHYRTISSGNWSNTNIWETAIDTTEIWMPATQAPSYFDNSIHIRNGHHVHFNSNIVVDQLVIEEGGTLERAGGELVVQDGLGDDIIVYGRFLHSAGSVMPNFIGTIRIKTNGILEVVANNSTSFYGMNVNIFYETNATFYWNVATSATIINGTYFPNAGPDEIPVFKLKVGGLSFGGNISNPTLINGIFHIESGTITVQYSGAKIFRNGIRGNGNLVQKTGGNDSGPIIINGNYAELGGSGLITLNNNGMEIDADTKVNLLSGKTINQGLNVTTATITIHGIFDFKNFQLTGSANTIFTSTSKIITAHPIGLNGSILTNGNNFFSPSMGMHFNGILPQTSGTLMPNEISTLIINNEKGLTLSKHLKINDLLEFKQGKLISDASALVTVNYASITGNNAGSYIIGPLVYNILTISEKIIPVGNTISYKPISIIQSSIGPGSYYIKYNDYIHGTTIVENNISAISHTEHWIVEPQIGTESARIKLFWDSDQNFQNTSNLIVAKFNGALWKNLGNNSTIAGSLVNGNITSEISSGFNAVTFGFLSFGGALPVTLTLFSGKRVGEAVELNWQTLNEYNNSHFNIEKSIDGTNFEFVGMVNGSGTTELLQNYSFIDHDAYLQRSYYRLKQFDYNGVYEYHKIVSIDAFDNPFKVSLYPVPAVDKLFIDINGDSDTIFDMVVTDINGKYIFSSEIKANEKFEMDISNYRKGSYLFILKCPQNLNVIKWIKQ